MRRNYIVILQKLIDRKLQYIDILNRRFDKMYHQASTGLEWREAYEPRMRTLKKRILSEMAIVASFEVQRDSMKGAQHAAQSTNSVRGQGDR